MEEWAQILYGALGAAAPENVRLFRVVTGRTRESLPRFNKVYFVVTAVFLLFGGVFSFALNPQSPWAALYIGATFPIIVSAWLRSDGKD